ncbi:hypothetical protein RND81_07G023300 [Saponaria officinalis]|uniref:Gag-pol polyprotein n=1 Tax=Saponaria officinalis TaxID=3572 RepID=A0AAW1JMY3_SAPOF
MGPQFGVPKFDGKSSFTLWQRRMKDLLVNIGLARALIEDGGKSEKFSDADWEEICTKCASSIRLCISDSVINSVLDDDSPSKI